jgi:hypothetical protein
MQDGTTAENMPTACIDVSHQRRAKAILAILFIGVELRLHEFL